MDNPDLKDKVVVITGAARGMGRSYAEAFLAAGAKLVCTDLSWSGEDAFRGTLEASGNALVLEFDITDPGKIAQACRQTLQRFGTVDVLVNNAALRQRDFYRPSGTAPILQTTDEQWTRMFDVNVVGTLRVIREFIKPMQARRRGSIINVSAESGVPRTVSPGVWAGLQPRIRIAPYSASKAALTAMTFFLADEVLDSNIAVNAVFPAGTRTTGSDELYRTRKSRGEPTGTFLEPEHVVPLVLHLALQDASGETGRAYNAVIWNESHGFGSIDKWTHPDA